MTTDVLIQVQDLKKHFTGTSAIKALDGVSVDIKKGEVVVVIGPSGSGKSTFLRCLNLLETPSAGTITFGGTEITDPKTEIDKVRRQMGMVFQHFNLFPNMTIRRNITLAPVRTGLMKQGEADAEAVKLLERVGLADRADSYPAQLSGGQKQRIAIARIFLKNPPILILDEATSALDSVTEAKIQHAFDKLAAGRTTLIIAHRLSTIRNADRIISISDGVITECGTHDELLRKGGIYAELYKTQNALALETLGQ